MMPDISIIMPTYNRADYISESIDSIRNQTHKDWELIIVDDGSTDATPDILTSYAQNDARIQTYHQNHQGAAIARNEALKKAQAPNVTFQDDDDFSHPLRLTTYMKHLSAYPDTDVLMPVGAFFTSATLETCEDPYNYSLIISCLKRTTIDKVGGYRPFLSAEDVDLLIRLKENKAIFRHIPEVLYYYRIHDNISDQLSAAISVPLCEFGVAFSQWCREHGIADEGNNPQALMPNIFQTARAHMPRQDYDNMIISKIISNFAYRIFKLHLRNKKQFIVNDYETMRNILIQAECPPQFIDSKISEVRAAVQYELDKEAKEEKRNPPKRHIKNDILTNHVLDMFPYKS